MKSEYGERLFGNTTNFSPLIIKEFNISVLKPMFIKMTIALFALFACFSLYGFLVHALYIGIGMAIMAVLITPIMIYGYKVGLDKSNKMNKLCSSNTFVDYYFEQDGVRTSTRKGDVEVASFAIDYRMISKIVEHSHYLYLFITDSQVYIVDKNGMTEGKEAELCDFLKSKVANFKSAKIKKQKEKN